jgi:ABC-type nickel/cobalt efflux system permease component RcnA
MTAARRVPVLALLAVALFGLTVAPAEPAQAHPLGNFTTNTAAAVGVRPNGVEVGHVLDLAEIPTVQARQQIDTDDDGALGAREEGAYRAGACAQIAGEIVLRVDGRRRPLRVDAARLSFPAGQAGLATLRLECDLVAAGAVEHGSRVLVVDGTHPDRIGWREMTARGDGLTLAESDVPTESVSARLTAYPEDRLRSPLDVRRAELVVGAVVAGPGAASEPLRGGSPRGVDRLGLAALIGQRRLTPAVASAALLVALLLGAGHALAPGHGKTLMAAYVVGERGTSRHALVIGATVAATHTVGVLLLGLAVSASQTLVPERVYPWFGVASGALVVAVGAGLLRRALRTRAHTRAHPHTGHHGHHGHHHHHAHPHPQDGHWRQRPPRGAELLALGLAGGLVPSPSALVVLLGAVGLGHPTFGVALVVAYGVGLAATQVAAGLALLRARRLLDRWADRRPGLAPTRLAGVMPLLTAGLVLLGGVVVTVCALTGV